MFTFDRAAYERKVRWFTESRFGMFIHWGLYAIPSRGEWVRSTEQIAPDAYHRYFDEFNPVDYDPKAWAKAAREAGMKYAVLTAKHHDGFCLFDTKLTDFKSTNTKCKRDLVREYVDAFRAEGLKVGLYYSLLDWDHPDYPHYGDQNHPQRADETQKNENRDFSRYLDYMHAQVKELCTNYGKIDIFWFDFSYGQLRGEAWRATELVRMIRTYQPDVLMDNRLEVSGEGFGSIATANPTEYSGDFVSPEHIIPPEGIRDELGRPVVWESCTTMNNHWGHCREDHYYKDSGMLVKKLVECVSKGGNLLINVGPDARGNIPPESLAILSEVGDWMRKNGESVYGCGVSGLPKPDCGRVTGKGNTLYFHILEPQVSYIPLVGVPRETIERVRLLSTGSELKIVDDWISRNYPDVTYVSLGADPKLPDPTDTVIEVTLKRA